MENKNKTISFISDCHLGYRQYFLERREKDFEDAFYDACEKSHKAGVKTILCGGDLCDSKRPPSRTYITFLKEKVGSFFKENGINFYSVTGNHEKSDPPWLKGLPDCFHLLDYNSVITEEGIKVDGLPEMTREEYKEQFAMLKGGDVLVIHGPLQEFVKYPSEKALALDDLPLDKYQLIIIGDTHVSSIIEYKGCTVVSPGSTELCSKSESDVKYLWFADFEDGKLTGVRQEPIKTRPVYWFSIKSEDEIENVVENVRKVAHQDPIIYLTYKADVVGAVKRVSVLLDHSKAIFRPEPVYEEKDVELKKEEEDYEGEVKVEDLLAEMIDINHPIYPLMYNVLKSRENPNEAISEYIKQRTEQLNEN